MFHVFRNPHFQAVIADGGPGILKLDRLQVPLNLFFWPYPFLSSFMALLFAAFPEKGDVIVVL